MSDEFSQEEIERRARETARRMLTTPKKNPLATNPKPIQATKRKAATAAKSKSKS